MENRKSPLDEEQLSKVNGGLVLYYPDRDLYMVVDDNTGMIVGEYEDEETALRIAAECGASTQIINAGRTTKQNIR